MLLNKFDLFVNKVSARPIPAPNRYPIVEEENNVLEKITIFLGGTCNGSKWRDKLIPMLNHKFEPFNPVVDDWNEEAQEREIYHRMNDDFVLYCITPMMSGFYSIAEMIDDMNKRPLKTIVCFLYEDGNGRHGYTAPQLNSVEAVLKMLKTNDVPAFTSLEDLADYLNTVIAAEGRINHNG